jgi:hypothetical protein
VEILIHFPFGNQRQKSRSLSESRKLPAREAEEPFTVRKPKTSSPRGRRAVHCQKAETFQPDQIFERHVVAPCKADTLTNERIKQILERHVVCVSLFLRFD